MSLLASMLLAVLGAAGPTPVDVRVSLSPAEIPYHKQAVFTVTAVAPEGTEIRMPDMRGKFGGADVYGEPERSVQTLDDGRVRTSVRYVLDAVWPGLYRIDPVEVTWEPGGRAVVGSPVLRVRDLTPDEEIALAEFKPIALPAEPRPFLDTWLGRAAAIAAPVLTAVALMACFLARRRRKAIEAALPPMPWDIARERLRNLASDVLIGANDPGAYYVELSDILRRYIEDRFRLNAPERTTPEFLAEAASTGFFGNDHQQLLEGVLRHADRVKFALDNPPIEQIQADFREVSRFVDETVPRMAAPAATEAAA